MGNLGPNPANDPWRQKRGRAVILACITFVLVLLLHLMVFVVGAESKSPSIILSNTGAVDATEGVRQAERIQVVELLPPPAPQTQQQQQQPVPQVPETNPFTVAVGEQNPADIREPKPEPKKPEPKKPEPKKPEPKKPEPKKPEPKKPEPKKPEPKKPEPKKPEPKKPEPKKPEPKKPEPKKPKKEAKPAKRPPQNGNSNRNVTGVDKKTGATGTKGEGLDGFTSASDTGKGLHNPKPPYPARSVENGEEGTVVLRVKVSEKGLPLSVELVTSSGYKRLDHSAIETVKKYYHFIPATRYGKPVESFYTFKIVFSLSD